MLSLKWVSRYIRFVYLDEVINFKPDIIHAHDLETLRAATYFKKLTGCKVIYDAHEFEIDRNPPMGKLSKLYVRQQEGKYIKSVDLVVTVSNEIADELQTNYTLKEKPLVILNIPAKAQFSSFDFRDLHASLAGPSGPGNRVQGEYRSNGNDKPVRDYCQL